MQDRNFWQALLVSVGVHFAVVGSFAGLVQLLARVSEPEELSLEFSILPPVVQPVAAKAPPARAAKKWNLPEEGAPVDAPADDGEPADEASPCDDCIAGENDYVPLSKARRGLRWKSGFITRDDYPPEALRKGFEGKVKVMVYISREGRVRAVRLVAGSHASLNEIVLRKLELARFDPGRDENGQPIPVKMILPIKFHLR